MVTSILCRFKSSSRPLSYFFLLAFRGAVKLPALDQGFREQKRCQVPLRSKINRGMV